jgi:hypothetical protein
MGAYGKKAIEYVSDGWFDKGVRIEIASPKK